MANQKEGSAMTEYLFYFSAMVLTAAIVWRFIAVIIAASINVIHPDKKDINCSPVIIAHFGGVMPAVVLFFIAAVIHGVYG